MSISKKNCPVPFEQQPLNEYFALKESIFFSWSVYEKPKYFLFFLYILIILFILFIPFAKYLVPLNKNFLKLILIDVSFVSFILSLIFLRLYLGWSYVIKRLLSATVFYEESGWYDGQIWVKTAESLMQDRLIGFYEVLPFIQRIKYSLFSSLIFFIADTILCYLL
uniref:Ycf36 n=1 Tax=Antithamnionella ternifolia TaxID=207919 RepID=A0A4D6WP52_9FLOR|nr:hypothetical protein [Antithamnionella ternifolia]